MHCGSADEVNQRIAEGWQFLAIGSELKMMLEGTAAHVQKLTGAATGGEMARY